MFAIGGVGGSGTRVVSGVISRLGYSLGSDLNAALDNLHFTLIFKRPEILDIDDEEFAFCFAIFNKILSKLRLLPQELEYLSKLSSVPRWHVHSVEWLRERLLSVPVENGDECWRGLGWKEPNTHLVLDRLWRLAPDLKYVHVRRNGLDMAFSQNQNQPRFWGERILGEVARQVDPVYSLRYWCAAEKRVENIVSSMQQQGNFFLLNYDLLCRNPEPVISDLLRFFGVSVEACVLEELVASVRPPKSIGRYRDHDCSCFSDEQIQCVENLMCCPSGLA